MKFLAIVFVCLAVTMFVQSTAAAPRPTDPPPLTEADKAALAALYVAYGAGNAALTTAIGVLLGKLNTSLGVVATESPDDATRDAPIVVAAAVADALQAVLNARQAQSAANTVAVGGESSAAASQQAFDDAAETQLISDVLVALNAQIVATSSS